MKATLNIEFLEYLYLRGLEGMVSDKFLEIVVKNEWTDLNVMDEAFKNNGEAKNIAIQLFFKMKGWAL